MTMNSLSKWMSEMADSARLVEDYTNKSLRATSIS